MAMRMAHEGPAGHARHFPGAEPLQLDLLRCAADGTSQSDGRLQDQIEAWVRSPSIGLRSSAAVARERMQETERSFAGCPGV